jgi:hypothetical protein
MTRTKMIAVDKVRPEDSVAEASFKGPMFRGDQDWDYLCAHCGAVIAKGVEENIGATFKTDKPGGRVLIKCSKCQKLSTFP